jgi:adenylate cyclase
MNRSIILGAIIISAAILLNGYLERVARAPHSARTPEKQRPDAREKSIAVLPFQDLSSPTENANFADSVQEEILTNLSKIADLKVISRTNVMQYKNAARHDVREIGKQLGVACVLEGAVRRADKRVRVTVQLVDARTESHLWAESYDREITDVSAVGKEIATNVADILRTGHSPP